ncbi:MAG: hypothetical protein PHP92_03505 [Candidatus Nanoarchaeia archaeon]|nr:hypothetical protein [Candidatus Nanoarchaeia archaeon]
MQLRCVKNEIEVGFFKKKMNTVNLTIGKVYNGYPIVYGVSPTDIDDCCFLIYNDLKEWNVYPLDLFKPE